jgi:hypothetical protein
MFPKCYLDPSILSFSGKQDDLPTLKKKLLFQLVSNYYNLANQSTRIKEFIRKHVGLSSFLICNICYIFSDLIIILERCYFNMCFYVSVFLSDFHNTCANSPSRVFLEHEIFYFPSKFCHKIVLILYSVV